MDKAKCSGRVPMIKLELLSSGLCLVGNQGFRNLAEEPFSYFIVAFKLLLIKHSAMSQCRETLVLVHALPIYYLCRHLTALTYFNRSARQLFANLN